MKNKKEKRQRTGKRIWKMTEEEKEDFLRNFYSRAGLLRLIGVIEQREDEKWTAIRERLGVPRDHKLHLHMRIGEIHEE